MLSATEAGGGGEIRQGDVGGAKRGWPWVTNGQAKSPRRWPVSDEKPELRGEGQRRQTLPSTLWPFPVPQFPHERNEAVGPEVTAKAPSSFDVIPRDH